MSSRKAQCTCGQVKLTTKSEPIRVAVCHCEECQRRTGSIFGVQARFYKKDVEIGGETKAYSRIGDSGGTVKQEFCLVCGSIVSLELSDFPEFVTLPVGLFAAPEFPKPTLSVYEQRKHDWFDFTCEIEHIE